MNKGAGSGIYAEYIGKGYIGEFDPGSARTLAACLTHASRGAAGLLLMEEVLATGERVSNT